MTAVDLASALARARALLGECSAFKVQLFCEVAASGADGIEQLTLATRIGALKQRGSAAVRDLTDVDYLGLPGPGLVQIEANLG